VRIGIRPEKLSIVSAPPEAERPAGPVEVASFLGVPAVRRPHPGGEELTVSSRTGGRRRRAGRSPPRLAARAHLRRHQGEADAPESFERASSACSPRPLPARFGRRAGRRAARLRARTLPCGLRRAEGRGGGGRPARRGQPPQDAARPIVFSNWPLYIDKKVIKDFEREFDAKLSYREDINDNNEFFGKVRQPLQQGDGIGRDLVSLTDWMAARWIRLGYVEPIDKRNVPTSATCRTRCSTSPSIAGRKFSLPWQSGMTGIGYNRKEVGEVKSIKQLFDPKYKGKVTLLTESRDTLGLIMLMQGKNPTDASIDDVLAAADELDKQNRAGQIRKFTGNEYTTDLTKGNVVLCMAYSGDVGQLKKDNPDLEFVIPEEGAILWSDNMMIPKGAKAPTAPRSS
jgi:spermidine/putrescine transport system substrate-binding protein